MKCFRQYVHNILRLFYGWANFAFTTSDFFQMKVLSGLVKILWKTEIGLFHGALFHTTT